MKSYNVLILDPSVSTGYCLIKITNDDLTCDIYQEGILFLDNKSDYVGDTCLELMNKVETILVDHDVKHVGIEDYYFNRRKATGSTLNVELRASLYVLCRMYSIPYTMININAWKTFIAGRSMPTKEQKAKWGKEPANKLFIQEALWLKFGFRFPNFCLSPKTNKPVAFKSDVVDAVGQGIYFCRMILHAREVTRSSKIPEDHIFKTTPKKTYVYSTKKKTKKEPKRLLN